MVERGVKGRRAVIVVRTGPFGKQMGIRKSWPRLGRKKDGHWWWERGLGQEIKSKNQVQACARAKRWGGANARKRGEGGTVDGWDYLPAQYGVTKVKDSQAVLLPKNTR
jgi:hypothetical protein